jgi:hypothetical protein
MITGPQVAPPDCGHRLTNALPYVWKSASHSARRSESSGPNQDGKNDGGGFGPLRRGSTLAWR